MLTDKLEIIKGDITRMEVDAIVNAANSQLRDGEGVNGAIHRAGGPAILAECSKIVAHQKGCPTGEAVITTAGKLPAKFVIHTVGPVWNGDRQNGTLLLTKCYQNSLKLAEENGCKTIAFPNISTGIYGYPKTEAATIAVNAVTKFLSGETKIKKVIFVCYEQENFDTMDAILNKLK